MKTKLEAPRWIMSVRDLPADRTPAKYEVKKPDAPAFVATLDKRKRQVVDAMLSGPLYCASTVRLGDAIFRLKEDHDLYAETKATVQGRKYYALNGNVRRIDGEGQ